MVREWEKREIPEVREQGKKIPSILDYVTGLKKNKPCVKVFLQNNDEDAKRFFEQRNNSSEMTEYEFVYVNEILQNISEEDKEIEKREMEAPKISQTDRVNLEKIISSEEEKIFANHSTVVGIGVSNVLTKQRTDCKQPCIVLYCLDKDLIPYGEKPLPHFINGYPCDIREEICMIMAGSCKDCQMLNTGCDIGCDTGDEISTGTAGFLINGKNEEFKGFLTAAHVVIDAKQHNFLNPLNIYKENRKKITHPSDSSKVIGEVQNCILGNFRDCGTDIAIVQSLSERDGITGRYKHKQQAISLT